MDCSAVPGTTATPGVFSLMLQRMMLEAHGCSSTGSISSLTALAAQQPSMQQQYEAMSAAAAAAAAAAANARQPFSPSSASLALAARQRLAFSELMASSQKPTKKPTTSSSGNTDAKRHSVVKKRMNLERTIMQLKRCKQEQEDVDVTSYDVGTVETVGTPPSAVSLSADQLQQTMTMSASGSPILDVVGGVATSDVTGTAGNSSEDDEDEELDVVGGATEQLTAQFSQQIAEMFRSPNAALKHHKRKHRKLPPTAPSDCEECGKSFASPFQLKEHIVITHLKEKNFVCEQCNQKFGRRGGLRRHIQMVHQNHLHKCPYSDCDHPGYKCSKRMMLEAHGCSSTGSISSLTALAAQQPSMQQQYEAMSAAAAAAAAAAANARQPFSPSSASLALAARQRLAFSELMASSQKPTKKPTTSSSGNTDAKRHSVVKKRMNLERTIMQLKRCKQEQEDVDVTSYDVGTVETVGTPPSAVSLSADQLQQTMTMSASGSPILDVVGGVATSDVTGTAGNSSEDDEDEELDVVGGATEQLTAQFSQQIAEMFRSPNAALKHHKRKHRKLPPTAPSDCEECGKSFASPFQLKEHIVITHLKEKNFVCEQCNQKFGRRGGLRRHIQMVHQNHLHKCPYSDCDHPGYKCSKALTAHIRSVHTNIRPYECDDCGKSFVRRNDLKMHQMTHAKQLMFHCKCGSHFRRQIYLRKHQKSCRAASCGDDGDASEGAAASQSLEKEESDESQRAGSGTGQRLESVF